MPGAPAGVPGGLLAAPGAALFLEAWTVIASSLGRVIYVGLATAPVATMAVIGVPDEHATTIGALFAVVVAVATGIAWMDARGEKRIRLHEEKEDLGARARDRLEEERHHGLMAEIGHIRELVGVREEVRAMRREWRARHPQSPAEGDTG